MGWTWYRATYCKNGGIDGHYEVFRSSMVGSVYYAAVKAKFQSILQW